MNDALATLRKRLLARIRRDVTIDAAFFATCDPKTLLFTSAWADDTLAASAPRFLDNEFGAAPDVNRFASLASARRGVATLDGATRGDRAESTRFREIIEPLRLGDELRVALRAGGTTWGFLCLHREAGVGFSAHDATAVERLARVAAEEIRQLVVDTAARMVLSGADAAVVLVDADRVLAVTAAAEALLDAPIAIGGPPPFPVLVAVRRLQSFELAGEADAVVRTTVMRSNGLLVAIHASRTQAADGAGPIAVTLAPAGPAARSSLLLAAHGLTPAQLRVAALVLRGKSTRQIVRELGIGAHTVQDHLKAAFEKVGVSTRRDLVAALMR